MVPSTTSSTGARRDLVGNPWDLMGHGGVDLVDRRGQALSGGRLIAGIDTRRLGEAAVLLQELLHARGCARR